MYFALQLSNIGLESLDFGLSLSCQAILALLICTQIAQFTFHREGFSLFSEQVLPQSLNSSGKIPFGDDCSDRRDKARYPPDHCVVAFNYVLLTAVLYGDYVSRGRKSRSRQYGGVLFVFFFLFLAVVLLMVLVGVAYRSDSPVDLAEPDRQLDRLAAILEPDVMEGVIQRARSEGVSESDVLNRLIRLGLEHPPRL